MTDSQKTKAQLIDELSKLRQKITSHSTDIKLDADLFLQTEESMRVLMNSNPEAFFLLDTKGKFIAVNEKAAERFGKKPDELINTNVFSYLDSQIARHRREKVDEVIRTGKPVRFDDSRNNRYYDNYLHPVFDSEANVINIAVWVIEFTKRKQAVDALKASEEKFRELAENIDDVFWISRGKEILYISPAFEKIFGRSCESIYNRPQSFLEAIHPEDLTRVFKSLRSEKYKKEGIFNEEYRIIHTDGSVVWISARTFPIFKNGKLIRTAGIAEDISLRKKAEEVIQMALRKEKGLSGLKSRFISLVSHEFRTPLGLILSSTELLEIYGDKWGEEKKSEHFGRIKKAVENLTSLLTDVMTISKEDSGLLKVMPIQIELVSFLKEIIEEAKSSAEECPTIYFNTSNTKISITADEKLLRHIFLNLLSNAIKYTAIEKNIFVKLSKENDLVLCEVADEGIGIEKEDMKEIFDPFSRGRNIGKVGGSGLGLAIVRKAIDLHYGKISFNSKPGKGTSFIVELPVEYAEEQLKLSNI
jgi:PAS domain S-box-containing protein